VLLLIGWLVLHDRRVIAKHDAAIEAAASAARDQAADERTQDAVTNTRNEQDLHHAIDGAPTGGSLSPAAHGLACERLRKLGRFPLVRTWQRRRRQSRCPVTRSQPIRWPRRTTTPMSKPGAIDCARPVGGCAAFSSVAACQA
jgi:hypothetical protein